MPKNDKAIKVLNPILLSVHMTKLKIYKMARIKKLTVSQLFVIGMIKYITKEFPESDLEEVRLKRNSLH